MGPITELPELDESSMYDSKNQPARGGGNRNFGGRSSKINFYLFFHTFYHSVFAL